MSEFGRNGKRYDYTKYDAFLLDNYYSPERIYMLCERLENAEDLSGETAKKLRLHISEHLEEVTECLIKHESIDTAELLINHGFINQDNMDSVINQVYESDNTELLSFLMHFKHDNYSDTEEEFLL